MTSKLFASLALAGVAVLGATANANDRVPCSLLVYPCYDNTRGTETLITVTNTNTDFTPGANNVPVGQVQVEFVYINGDNCLETNRTRTLTPGDTLTVLASVDNPNSDRGYVFVFAKRNGAAISFNHLIGTSFTLSSNDSKDFELSPVCFKALSQEGAPTDVDSDGRRDLNGVEYTKAADVLAFARFFGQRNNTAAEADLVNGARSQLCLINLAGARFQAVVDFLVYNDNEEVFSAQRTLDCWDRVNLADINGVFTNDFLKYNTNHNPGEILLNGHLGGTAPETGWFTVDGLIANSSADFVADPAILAALVECISGDGGAQLPWGLGEQSNGDLLNLSIFADNN
jgi:hypothetical protein